MHLGTWGRLRGVLALVACVLGGGAFLPTLATASCPNEPLRDGLSAQLPDCRAYELVTPSDTNGRRLFDVTAISGFYDLFPTELASPYRESMVYSTWGGPITEISGATGFYDTYEAVREDYGWQTVRRITPSGDEAVFPTNGGVSADHGYSFVRVPQGEGGSLAAEGDADYLGKPDGSFELTGVGSLGVERLAQGQYISPGGQHVLFSTGGIWCQQLGVKCKRTRLEVSAPETGTAAVYDRGPDGPTLVVSLLPGNKTPSPGEDAEYAGASRDGTAVAFEIGGTLYVRLNNTETKEVADQSPTYAGISADGSYLFYVREGNIFRFSTGSSATEQVSASGDADIVNVSADGSHVYFISHQKLDGDQGAEGEPNLYVWAGDGPRYIATIRQSDLERTSGESADAAITALGVWTTLVVNPDRHTDVGLGPGANASRTTPDGKVIVFESRAQLTSYDNAGHTEVYRYDTDDPGVICVSCNPGVEPAEADAHLQDLEAVRPPTVIHNLTDDGAKVFFETKEALVARDTGGTNDVYEWQIAAPGFDGTVALISSGVTADYPVPPASSAPRNNVLMGITPDGDDVFFVTEDALVTPAGQGDSQAIYDARVNGGFAEASPAAPCGELMSCQATSGTSPALGVGQSWRIRKGNVKPQKKRRCRRSHRPQASKADRRRRCRHHRQEVR